MFFIVLRKLINNRWLVICLLLGSIIVVAMISSIPIYTDGILQRMLTKDLESYQQQTGYYPGSYHFTLNSLAAHRLISVDALYNSFLYSRENIWDMMEEKLGVPLVTKVEKLTLDHIKLTPEVKREEKPRERSMELVAYSGYKDHITITRGRLPSPDITDGVLEVLINSFAQKRNDILLDETYLAGDILNQLEEGLELKIKPVGFFSYKDAKDLWWFDNSFNKGNIMLVDYELFNRYFLKNNAPSNTEWFFAIDYTKLKVDDLPHLLEVFNENEAWYTQHYGTKVNMGAKSIIEEYFSRERQIRLTLWVLQVPIIIMLTFYIFMISQLIIENEKNEIAVLKSRGASRNQIFGIYFIQSCLLSAIAVILGLFLAVGICQILGASNGFLELVSRKALPIVMRPRFIYYGILAGVFSVVTMMIPAMRASRLSIVEYKQKKARKWNAPIWQKMFLDVILIGIAIYGYRSFLDRQITLNITAAEGIEVPIDPLLFLISTLFILGVGLLFLRIYPYIIRFVYWAGRKLWTPVLYSSFIQVGRSGGREQFLMLFLILTMSVGVFSANSARTINQNIEDKVYYETGADIIMQVEWDSNEPPENMYMMAEQPASTTSDSVIIYQEPDFDMIRSIEGIENAARVLIPEDARIRIAGNNFTMGSLMAVEPSEFGQVVWSSNDLLPHHINEYLNLLTQAPNAVIVSSAFRDDQGFELGDSIEYNWERQALIEGNIAAFVDYWPGINPHVGKNRYFVIANLNYVQAKTMLEPYQVWMKKADGALSHTIYNDIEEKDIDILWLKDASQEMIVRKNDALLEGTNGALTMGFIVTMLISLLGFIIYWILSIQSRRLQFGIFRAMGMTRGRVISILICEQVMISLAAILVGLVIGGLVSYFFVPLLQMVYSAEQQVPPFRVVSSRADYYKIYAIVGFMLASGFIILGVLISKLKMVQAIKLGED